jgi:hypothetical protein
LVDDLIDEAAPPDAKTIWLFKERLQLAKLHDALFDRLEEGVVRPRSGRQGRADHRCDDRGSATPA